MECAQFCCSIPISVRDIKSWIEFINRTLDKLGPESSYYHGACLVFLDGIGCGSGKEELISRSSAENFISNLLSKHGKMLRKPEMTAESELYGISPFFVQRGNTNVYLMRNFNLPSFQFCLLFIKF